MSSKKIKTRNHHAWQLAALMVARGEKTKQQIAAELSITVVTLGRWEAEPEFAAEVEAIRASFRQGLIDKGIADKANRLEYYENIMRRMFVIIEARSCEPDAELVRGERSGLIARDVRFSKTGEPIDIGRVDKALLSEIREYLKQAAIEVGDWQERQTVTNVNVEQLSDEQLERIASGEPVERVVTSPRRA